MKKCAIVFVMFVLAFTFQSSLASAQKTRTDSRSRGEKQMTAAKQEEEVPFACSLTALNASQREHHKELSKQLRESVKETREMRDGYGFRLPGDGQTVAMAAEWITLERLCCPFFTFQLEIGSEGKPIWLRMTGREGVKQFMQSEFGIK
jgi:hypothetical protein